jgi:hypothetical protein
MGGLQAAKERDLAMLAHYGWDCPSREFNWGRGTQSASQALSVCRYRVFCLAVNFPASSYTKEEVKDCKGRMAARAEKREREHLTDYRGVDAVPRVDGILYQTRIHVPRVKRVTIIGMYATAREAVRSSLNGMCSDSITL